MTSERGYEIEPEPSFRERLLDFRTMEPRFRILAGIVIAQIAATSLLLLLHEPWMQLTVYLEDPLFGTVTISLVHYAFSCTFLLIGISLFMRGLYEADHRGVIALLSILGTTYVLAILKLLPLVVGITLLIDLLILAFLGVVVALTIPSLVVWGARYRWQSWWRFGILLLIMILGLLGLVSFGFMLTRVPAHFVAVLNLLRIPFVTLFFIAAADWAELTDFFARFVARGLQVAERDNRLIIANVIVSALAIGLFGYTVESWSGFFAELLLSMMIVAMLSGLLRVAGFRGHWPTQFPWAALVLVVVGFNIPFMLLKDIVATVDFSVCFTILMSVLLCLCGRWPKLSFLAPTMLLAVLLGLAATLWAWIAPTYFVIGLNGTLANFDIAMATLLILGWGAIRRAGIGDLRYLLGLFLVLNVSLFATDLLIWLYAAALVNSELFPVEAVVVAVAILGETLLSGHKLTNINSEWFSRRSRVLLFFSFVTITLATVLSWAPVHGQNENLKTIQMLMNPEFSVWRGIILLAPAMLWALFILRLGHWSAAKRGVSRDQQPVGSRSIDVWPA